MDLTPFAALLAATAIGTGLAATTFLIARRTPGLISAQASLVATLQANTAALSARVEILEDEAVLRAEKVAALEAEVTSLRLTVADLAGENARLRLTVPVRGAGQ